MEPSNAATIAAATARVLAIVAAASLAPAIAASRTDPTITLRME